MGAPMKDPRPPLLLVDDHPGVRRLIQVALRDLAAVDEAPDWSTAVALLEERDYRVVLLDLGLPGAPTPVSMIQAVQARRPSAAVVVITGRDVALSPLPPGVTLLGKPFDIADLRLMVAGVLDPGTGGG
nr:hypothetical protein [Bacillota bacterium]